MTWPQPTRQHHQHFCHAEGWERVRDARGRTGTHHLTYELTLPDGRILRTRISHPPDRTTYGPAIWAHILRDQLDIPEDAFWACVLHGMLPDRGTPEPPRETLPADLVRLLITRVGIPEDHIAKMDKTEAISRLQHYWTHGA
ncbi:MAG: cytotoxic translational repressor of toxin-antitoxin stability system [Streptomycetaceae bacterium]|nr:cytotoxic translational repressor of toxin-antitoxin stability system [Streptomycetaceae bacterium]